MPTYTTTVTRTGQITLSRPAREALNIHPGQTIVVNFNKNQLTVSRHLTDEEFFTLLDSYNASIPPEIIEKNRGKTASALMSEWADSPEGQAYFEEKYGPIANPTNIIGPNTTPDTAPTSTGGII